MNLTSFLNFQLSFTSLNTLFSSHFPGWVRPFNKTFNTAMPATRTEAEVTFTEEELFKVKCDVHPWMGAWVSVVSHPCFDVTGEDGRFDLEGLPAGSYEVEIWHEKLGSQTATAQVDENASAELEFTMSR